MPENPISVTVEVRTVRQWGGPQQKSLDTLLCWHASGDAETVLKIEEAVRAVLRDREAGAFSPRSESAERALEALGKNQQLCLMPKSQ